MKFDDTIFDSDTLIMPGCDAMYAYIYNHFDVVKEISCNSKDGLITINILFKGLPEDIEKYHDLRAILAKAQNGKEKEKEKEEDAL